VTDFSKPANRPETEPAEPEATMAPGPAVADTAGTGPAPEPVVPSEPVAPPGAPEAPAPPEPIRLTRTGALWMSLILAAVVLILLLVFIIQNSTRVDISFMGAHGHLPLGVALLLAAVSGVLLIAIPGTGRIVQLRRQVRRGRRGRRPHRADRLR
jgi:uncharacterized integral membrane protein